MYEVRDETRRYIDHLLAENQKLQQLVSALQGELESRESVVDQLRHQIDQVESQRRRFTEDFARVERQNNALAHLYVATHRLHTTLDHEEVLGVVQEIVANLLGSEEMVILEFTDPRQPRLTAACGLEAARLEALRREVAEGRGLVADVARSGKRHVGPGSGDSEPTACVPLTAAGEVRGVLAIFRLLAHKPGFQQGDLELLELLASHAGMALYRARAADTPEGAGR